MTAAALAEAALHLLMAAGHGQLRLNTEVMPLLF
jgi:hypothetical protein